MISGLQAIALQDNPLVIEARQQLPPVEADDLDDFLHRPRLCRLQEDVNIQPVLGLVVESDADVADLQVIFPGERPVFEGFADAPERLAQVTAGVGLGRLWPQQTGQFFPSLRHPRIKHQISQGGLR